MKFIKIITIKKKVEGKLYLSLSFPYTIINTITKMELINRFSLYYFQEDVQKGISRLGKRFEKITSFLHKQLIHV